VFVSVSLFVLEVHENGHGRVNCMEIGIDTDTDKHGY
jgi:hypothetical protein